MKRKKWLYSVCLGIFLIASLVACGDKNEENTQQAQSSEENQEKTLKIFGAAPPITVMLELLYPQGLIGLNYEPYPEDVVFMPDGVAQLPALGMHAGGKGTSYERIVALQPYIVFFLESTQNEVLEAYQSVGIKTVTIPAFDSTKYAQSISTIGEALGVQDRANAFIAFMESSAKKLDDLRAAITHRPKVYLAQGVDGLQSQCGKNEPSDLVYQMGGVNILSCEELGKVEHISTTNFEFLLKKDPDIIFVREVGLYQDILQNPTPDWQNLRAVQEKKVYYAPSTPSNWLMKPPSIMQVLGVPWAFSRVHPELLSSEEMDSVIFDFFKEFLKPLDSESYKRIFGHGERYKARGQE